MNVDQWLNMGGKHYGSPPLSLSNSPPFSTFQPLSISLQLRLSLFTALYLHPLFATSLSLSFQTSVFFCFCLYFFLHLDALPISSLISALCSGNQFGLWSSSRLIKPPRQTHVFCYVIFSQHWPLFSPVKMTKPCQWQIISAGASNSTKRPTWNMAAGSLKCFSRWLSSFVVF